MSGPIVEPQGMALFETNSWNGTPAAAQRRAHKAEPAASVAYRWLAFSFSRGPPPGTGWFTGS